MSEQFYKDMGRAIAKRDHARAGVAKWSQKVVEAEEEIQALMLTKNMDEADQTPSTEG